MMEGKDKLTHYTQLEEWGPGVRAVVVIKINAQQHFHALI